MSSHTFLQRSCAAFTSIALLAALVSGTLAEDRGCCPKHGENDEPCSYGPCTCQPRGTLFQWSYDTSFETPSPGWDEPLASDRPDFTEASSTVGRGKRQLEMGYTFIHDREEGSNLNAHSFPEALLRIGMLADWFELRLVWNYADERAREFGGGVDLAAGGEDLGIGCKLALTPQECMLPETAIILQMTVPTGSDDFTADEILPGFSLLYGWDINEQWATGTLSGISRAVDDVTGEPYVEVAQSWTVVRSWNDIVGSYAEWYVLAASGADTNHTENYFNGGFTVLLTDDIQWDIRAGVGLNEAADDYFVGSGLSIRK